MNGQIEGGSINNAVTSRLTGINFSCSGIAWTRRDSALRKKESEASKREKLSAATQIESNMIRQYLARCWRQKIERLCPADLKNLMRKDDTLRCIGNLEGSDLSADLGVLSQAYCREGQEVSGATSLGGDAQAAAEFFQNDNGSLKGSDGNMGHGEEDSSDTEYRPVGAYLSNADASTDESGDESQKEVISSNGPVHASAVSATACSPFPPDSSTSDAENEVHGIVGSQLPSHDRLQSSSRRFPMRLVDYSDDSDLESDSADIFREADYGGIDESIVDVFDPVEDSICSMDFLRFSDPDDATDCSSARSSMTDEDGYDGAVESAGSSPRKRPTYPVELPAPSEPLPTASVIQDAAEGEKRCVVVLRKKKSVSFAEDFDDSALPPQRHLDTELVALPSYPPLLLE